MVAAFDQFALLRFPPTGEGGRHHRIFSLRFSAEILPGRIFSAGDTRIHHFAPAIENFGQIEKAVQSCQFHIGSIVDRLFDRIIRCNIAHHHEMRGTEIGRVQ